MVNITFYIKKQPLCQLAEGLTIKICPDRLLYRSANNRRNSLLTFATDRYYAEPMPLVRSQSLKRMITDGTFFTDPHGIEARCFGCILVHIGNSACCFFNAYNGFTGCA